MTDPATIAASLTKAQREAILLRPRSYDVWGNPETYCVVPRVGTLNALYGRRLIELGGSDTHVRLSELGLSVRAHLEKSNAE